MGLTVQNDRSVNYYIPIANSLEYPLTPLVPQMYPQLPAVQSFFTVDLRHIHSKDITYVLLHM